MILWKRLWVLFLKMFRLHMLQRKNCIFMSFSNFAFKWAWWVPDTKSYFSFQIAMGQGQAELAIQTLKECARNGEWLCLKNLHLVIPWLPVLEKVRVISPTLSLCWKPISQFWNIMHLSGDVLNRKINLSRFLIMNKVKSFRSKQLCVVALISYNVECFCHCDCTNVLLEFPIYYGILSTFAEKSVHWCFFFFV